MNLNAASGRLIIGPSSGLTLSDCVNPAVSSTGEVSPTPRAVPRMIAVMRPERAVGSVTCHTVRIWLAPSAYDASLRLPGTSRITTSEARMMIGSIITLIARDAASPDFGQAEHEDERRVDEQARDDRGQRCHGLDDDAYEAREPVRQLVHEDGCRRRRAGPRSTSAIVIMIDRAHQGVQDAAGVERVERPGVGSCPRSRSS